MKGIKVIQDKKGKLKEIRVDASLNPELADEIYQLIRNRKGAGMKQYVSRREGSRLSLTAFRNLVGQAQKSGEISMESFLHKYPQWQRNVR